MPAFFLVERETSGWFATIGNSRPLPNVAFTP